MDPTLLNKGVYNSQPYSSYKISSWKEYDLFTTIIIKSTYNVESGVCMSGGCCNVNILLLDTSIIISCFAVIRHSQVCETNTDQLVCRQTGCFDWYDGRLIVSNIRAVLLSDLGLIPDQGKIMNFPVFYDAAWL